MILKFLSADSKKVGFNIFTFLVLIMTFTSCKVFHKKVYTGNYQVLTDTTKQNFEVLMLDKPLKIKDDKKYYSYNNDKIYSTQGVLIGKTMHGKYEAFALSGYLYTTGAFKNGLKEGDWIYYHRNGTIAKHILYSKGDTTSIVYKYDLNGLKTDSIIPLKIKNKLEKKEKRRGYFNLFHRTGHKNDSVISNDSISVAQ